MLRLLREQIDDCISRYHAACHQLQGDAAELAHIDELPGCSDSIVHSLLTRHRREVHELREHAESSAAVAAEARAHAELLIEHLAVERRERYLVEERVMRIEQLAISAEPVVPVAEIERLQQLEVTHAALVAEIDSLRSSIGESTTAYAALATRCSSLSGALEAVRHQLRECEERRLTEVSLMGSELRMVDDGIAPLQRACLETNSRCNAMILPCPRPVADTFHASTGAVDGVTPEAARYASSRWQRESGPTIACSYSRECMRPTQDTAGQPAKTAETLWAPSTPHPLLPPLPPATLSQPIRPMEPMQQAQPPRSLLSRQPRPTPSVSPSHRTTAAADARDLPVFLAPNECAEPRTLLTVTASTPSEPQHEALMRASVERPTLRVTGGGVIATHSVRSRQDGPAVTARSPPLAAQAELTMAAVAPATADALSLASEADEDRTEPPSPSWVNPQPAQASKVIPSVSAGIPAVPSAPPSPHPLPTTTAMQSRMPPSTPERSQSVASHAGTHALAAAARKCGMEDLISLICPTDLGVALTLPSSHDCSRSPLPWYLETLPSTRASSIRAAVPTAAERAEREGTRASSPPACAEPADVRPSVSAPPGEQEEGSIARKRLCDGTEMRASGKQKRRHRPSSKCVPLYDLFGDP